jgi:hypothetical protein
MIIRPEPNTGPIEEREHGVTEWFDHSETTKSRTDSPDQKLGRI